MLCSDVDELDAGRRWGNWLAILSKTFDVEFNGLLDEFHNFFTCVASGNASRQVRHVRPVARRAFLNDYNVSHGTILISSGQLALGWHLACPAARLRWASPQL